MVEYQWSVRVGNVSGDRVTVYVRQHRFDVGAPVQFDQKYDSLTALEYVLGAIGADIVNCLRTVARRRRVEIDKVEALVSGKLNNPLTHLGVVGEEGHPGLETVSVRVYVSSMEKEDRIRQVWAEMQERSPLVCTFRSAIHLELELQVII
jgi:OsmC-like protein